jgi:hypothetical protein
VHRETHRHRHRHRHRERERVRERQREIAFFFPYNMQAEHLAYRLIYIEREKFK